MPKVYFLEIFILKDDGNGFDPSNLSIQGHFGQLIMQQCAEELDGKLDITSILSQGSEIILNYSYNQLSFIEETSLGNEYYGFIQSKV